MGILQLFRRDYILAQHKTSPYHSLFGIRTNKGLRIPCTIISWRCVFVIAEDDVIEQVDSLHKFQLQNQEIAGRSSHTLQIINESTAWQKNKPRYLKKIGKGDKVLIENICLKKKGGKLEDKWNVPYLIDEVHSTDVLIVKNKEHSVWITQCKTLKKQYRC